MRILGLLILFSLFSLSGCLDRSEGPDPGAQLVADLATIDAYLDANSINAYKDKTGIRFLVTSVGTGGLPPLIDQQVKVNYTGRLLSGTVFDPGGVATGTVASFIAGWQYALPLFPKGTKATIYVPSGLGYGTNGVGNIPANANLVFDIDVQDVILSPAEKQRAVSDLAAIDKYLTDHTITAVKDSTGLRYVIQEPGSGPKPTWYTKVRFNLTGKLLVSGNTFFSGTSQPTDEFDSRVVDYLHGIKVGLTKLSAGGKATLYIPSGLGFGPAESSSSPVPGNSNLIYEIELLEVY